MRNTFTIFDDQLDSYEGKKGKIVQRVLTLVDATSNGPKMKQMCDLTVPETFMPLAGQSQGTPITVDITEISIFLAVHAFVALSSPRVRSLQSNRSVYTTNLKDYDFYVGVATKTHKMGLFCYSHVGRRRDNNAVKPSDTSNTMDFALVYPCMRNTSATYCMGYTLGTWRNR